MFCLVFNYARYTRNIQDLIEFLFLSENLNPNFPAEKGRDHISSHKYSCMRGFVKQSIKGGEGGTKSLNTIVE